MNPQFEQHIIRYAPAGFLGLGKHMQISHKGQFVKIDDLEREVMKSKQLTHTLDSARLRERQLDGRVRQLEKDNLDLVERSRAESEKRSQRDLALAGFLTAVDELIDKAASGKKGKSLKDKYLEARNQLV